MIEFRGAYPGNYEPETGKIQYLRIELGAMTPTEMEGILAKVKECCRNPPKANDINDATEAAETTQYPKEKEEARKKEKKMAKKLSKLQRAKNRSMHAKIMNGILGYLKENGGAKKEDIKQAILPGVTMKDKEYFTFYAAFFSLQKKEKIRRVDPNDQESDWILGEDDAL